MALSAFLLAMIAPLSSAQASGVSAIEVGDNEITVRFDDVVEKASTFVLAGPNRIAIDVTGAEPGQSPVYQTGMRSPAPPITGHPDPGRISPEFRLSLHYGVVFRAAI